MKVNPSHGVILPREAMLCKVTIEAVGKPTFYDVDLVCEVRRLQKHLNIFILESVNK